MKAEGDPVIACRDGLATKYVVVEEMWRVARIEKYSCGEAALKGSESLLQEGISALLLLKSWRIMPATGRSVKEMGALTKYEASRLFPLEH